MNSFTKPTERKEYRLENYRTCGICGDNVNCDVEGMISHMQSNHTLEEIATEISFQWRPDEPLAFNHPNGTVHFYASGSGGMATSRCGRTFYQNSIAPNESQEEWFERINYEHADADDYCGNCIRLQKRDYGKNSLPDPISE